MLLTWLGEWVEDGDGKAGMEAGRQAGMEGGREEARESLWPPASDLLVNQTLSSLLSTGISQTGI